MSTFSSGLKVKIPQPTLFGYTVQAGEYAIVTYGSSTTPGPSSPNSYNVYFGPGFSIGTLNFGAIAYTIEAGVVFVNS